MLYGTLESLHVLMQYHSPMYALDLSFVSNHMSQNLMGSVGLDSKAAICFLRISLAQLWHPVLPVCLHTSHMGKLSADIRYSSVLHHHGSILGKPNPVPFPVPLSAVATRLYSQPTPLQLCNVVAGLL